MCKIDLTKKLNRYEEYHTKCATKVTHFIGIPLVIFAIMTLASWIHIRVPGFFDISLLWIFSITVLVFSYFMDVMLAAVVTVMFLVFALIISLVLKEAPSWLNLQVFLYTFIIGLVLQLVGHFIETKKLSLGKDYMLVLIAPLFLAAELMSYFGLRKKVSKSNADEH